MLHLHMTLAALSVALFSFRFALCMTKSDKLKSPWLKITPHVIDTALLLIGVVMMVQLSLYPGQVSWMTEKLFAVAAYIFCGLYALKWARNNTMRVIGYLGAMGWVVLAARVAVTKQNFLF
ncbi:SirB2 family protein [Thalassotalea ponticola]|uniref:SirB2 family protein n=1 Tax=Thalassotalea ponticola TaxID=1523392 RepID=UPI0025B61E28|nr:SirB2 family protein [Thalassotalea ponticola]MDN3652536.1 SirB2 family protein [Thalassotalea ponticola]